jgi:hypothetical protein
MEAKAVVVARAVVEAGKGAVNQAVPVAAVVVERAPVAVAKVVAVVPGREAQVGAVGAAVVRDLGVEVRAAAVEGVNPADPADPADLAAGAAGAVEDPVVPVAAAEGQEEVGADLEVRAEGAVWAAAEWEAGSPGVVARVAGVRAVHQAEEIDNCLWRRARQRPPPLSFRQSVALILDIIRRSVSRASSADVPSAV